MLRFLVLLPLCLIQVTALQLTLLSNPVLDNSAVHFQWHAVITDPDVFTMQVSQDTTPQYSFSTVVRGGKSHGDGSTPVLSIPGPHTLQAIKDTGEILSEIHFQLPGPDAGPASGSDSDNTASSQSPTSSSTTDPKESSSTTGASKSTSSAAGKGSQTATPTSVSPSLATSTSPDSDSHRKKLAPSATVGPVGVTDPNQITPTTLGIDPAPTPNSQTPSGSSSKNKTPMVVGIVLGVIVALALFILGAIFFARRRRRSQATVSQFDRERMVRGPSPVPSDRTSNPRFDTPSMNDIDSPPYPDDEESPGYPQDKYRDSYPAEKYDDELPEDEYTVDAEGR